MKQFGKKDILLLGVLLFVLLGVWFGITFPGSEKGSYVMVTVDGEFYGKYPLNEPGKVAVTVDDTETNLFDIYDGKADMIQAMCPDQLCVHQKSISKNGETIVCLPNKVVLAVEGDEESDIDSIAK